MEYANIAWKYLWNMISWIPQIPLRYWENPVPEERGNIYILSDGSPDLFKVGITSRDVDSLLRDYKRSRPGVKSELFLQSIKRYKQVERQILDRYVTQRVPTQAGRLSEWVKGVSLKELKTYVEDAAYGRVLEIEDFYMIPDIVPIHIKAYIKTWYTVNSSITTGCNIDDIYDHYKLKMEILTLDITRKQQFCKHLLKYISMMLFVNTDEIKLKGSPIKYRYIKLKGISD